MGLPQSKTSWITLLNDVHSAHKPWPIFLGRQNGAQRLILAKVSELVSHQILDDGGVAAVSRMQRDYYA